MDLKLVKFENETWRKEAERILDEQISKYGKDNLTLSPELLSVDTCNWIIAVIRKCEDGKVRQSCKIQVRKPL